MPDARKHYVGVSRGKDSVALALRLREVNPDVDYEYLITPVGNELPEMTAHWLRLEELLGKPFIRLKPFTEGDGLAFMVKATNTLPNWRMRWCTTGLKIKPTIAFLTENAPCIQYVGLRADEEERKGIYGDIPGVEQCFPFQNWGWTIDDVWQYLSEKGIKIPQRTDCALCYGQRIIEWKRLWEQHPDLYEHGVQMEAETGHTFRSPGRDTWPAGLAELRDVFASGRTVIGEKKLKMAEDLDVRAPCRVCRL